MRTLKPCVRFCVPHNVLPRRFMPAAAAMMVPTVGDGRVMLAIPWQGHGVGTTDTPLATAASEPKPLAEEIEALLGTAARYFRAAPRFEDVLSVFTGIRPRVRREETHLTAALSRDHTIEIDRRALVTTMGGRWTTYRHKAEQTVDRAVAAAGLPQRARTTASLRIHGHAGASDAIPELAHYGSDAKGIRALVAQQPDLAPPLDAELPCTGAEVVWAVRHEMGRRVEDVLARRRRALFLNAAAAARMAPAVATLIARELGRDAAWVRSAVEQFHRLAAGYSASAVIRA
jgi:glycerol-3-phosphate dehydrogenase